MVLKYKNLSSAKVQFGLFFLFYYFFCVSLFARLQQPYYSNMKLLRQNIFHIVLSFALLTMTACDNTPAGIPLGEGNEITDPALDTQKPTLPEDVEGEPTKAELAAQIQATAYEKDLGGLLQVCWRTPKRKFYCEVAPRPELDVTPDPNCKTIFQAASISKTCFAYIVMRLWDRGIIDLDKPLYLYTDGLEERFCDVFADDDEANARNEEWAKRLTARIVLTHGSGIDNWVSSSGTSSEEKIPIDIEPDTKYTYSGEAIQYLQRVVEHIVGKNLEELAREEVFSPFGMDDTSYIFLDKYENTHAYGFNSSHVKKSQGKTKTPAAAYSMRTNVQDFSKFAEALIAGTGLSHEAHEILLMPYRRLGDEPEHWFGHGIRVTLNPGNDYGPIWHHGGSNTNFKGRFWILPKQGIYCIYFSSSNNGTSIARPLVSILYPEYNGVDIIL